jgi:hypothetical protein
VPLRGGVHSGLSGNSPRTAQVGTGMSPHQTAGIVHMPDLSWTAGSVTCDPAVMSVTDPLLVVRRHVDLLRVRSAICRHTR